MNIRRVPLGDLCLLTKGSSAISKTLPGEYPLVTTGADHKTSDSYQFDAEAVCIPTISSTGHGHASLKRIHYIRGKFALANLLVAARVRDPSVISAEFLARYLSYSKDRLIVPLMTGAANMSISLERLASVPVAFPILAAQLRIVKILKRIDKLNVLRVEADRRTAELSHAIFHETFGDPLAHEAKWPEVHFEDVTTRITYGFTSPMQHVASGVPIITAKNVLDGTIDFEEVHYADVSEFAALTDKSKPKVGDILVTKDGTIGRCAVVRSGAEICINQSVALLQPRHDLVLSEYLVNCLLYPSVTDFLNGMGKGQGLKHLQITELAKMPIPLPPLPLQQSFVGRMAQVQELENLQQGSRRNLDLLTQAVLHRAFTPSRENAEAALS